MYRAADIDVGFRENVALFNAGQLGNYLPMQVGTMYRFRYLKVVHRLRYANTASFLLMNLALTFGSTAICGLLGLAVLAVNEQADPSWLLVVGFVLLFALSLASALMPLPKRERTRRATHAGVGRVPQRLGERAPPAAGRRSRCCSSTP